MFLVVFYITIQITEYENVLLIQQNNPQNSSKRNTQIWTLCETIVYPDCETAHKHGSVK